MILAMAHAHRLRGLAPCVVTTVLTAAHVARAGNDEGILMGNQAAMTGGAVTATVSEGSAIWYNPAGLAAVPTQSLDLSASAYGLRFYSSPRFLEASNGASSDVHVTELVIVPSALAYVRPLNDALTFGFGLFAQRANDLILRGDLDAGSDGRWLITEAAYERLTYGGVSLGWKAARGLRLGASLFGFLDFFQSELQFGGGDASGSTTASFINSSTVGTRTSVGGMVSVGAQWDVTSEWTVGVSVRSPSLKLYDSSTENSLTTASLPQNGSQTTLFVPETRTSNEGNFKLTRPVQVRLGIARVWSRGFVSVDGDLSPALRQSDDDPQDAKFNVRVGGLYRVADEFQVGAVSSPIATAPPETTRATLRFTFMAAPWA